MEGTVERQVVAEVSWAPHVGIALSSLCPYRWSIEAGSIQNLIMSEAMRWIAGQHRHDRNALIRTEVCRGADAIGDPLRRCICGQAGVVKTQVEVRNSVSEFGRNVA